MITSPPNPTPLVLKNATTITPFRRQKDCSLLVENGKIAQIGHIDELDVPPHAELFELEGQFILPGFIDVHVHGGMGHDFVDSDPDTITEISRYHSSHGSTSILATLYPQPFDLLLESLQRLRKYLESAGPNRVVEGIHLEGPFLNPEMHGAIRPDHMWPASVQAFRELVEVAGPWLRYMTIAPEIDGGMDVLREASIYPSLQKGTMSPLHLSIGHSKADYEQISEAIDNGLDGVTHIFNALPQLHHRKPGVLGGTLLKDELFVEVIADAVHIHPAILQLLVKVKSTDKIILITDAMKAVGMPDGEYEFSAQRVQVRHGRAYLTDSPETLAGSTLTMDHALRTMMHHAGTSLEQSAQMASLNASRILEWKNRRGILAVGKDADLVVMDSGFNVRMAIKAGHVIFS